MAYRIQRVQSENLAGGISARLIAIVLALLVAAIAFALNGANLAALGAHVVKSTFGSNFGLMDVGLILTPLILTGLSVMIALKVGAWNIGAEGQFCAGAFAASGVALFVPGPTVLILNDPTRGVDVGAKAEIYALCDELARSGLALLFTSSEVEEIVGVCDRILVMYRGRMIKEFARGEADKEAVTFWVSGGKTVMSDADLGAVA